MSWSPACSLQKSQVLLHPAFQLPSSASPWPNSQGSQQLPDGWSHCSRSVQELSPWDAPAGMSFQIAQLNLCLAPSQPAAPQQRSSALALAGRGDSKKCLASSCHISQNANAVHVFLHEKNQTNVLCKPVVPWLALALPRCFTFTLGVRLIKKFLQWPLEVHSAQLNPFLQLYKHLQWDMWG